MLLLLLFYSCCSIRDDDDDDDDDGVVLVLASCLLLSSSSYFFSSIFFFFLHIFRKASVERAIFPLASTRALISSNHSARFCFINWSRRVYKTKRSAVIRLKASEYIPTNGKDSPSWLSIQVRVKNVK